MKHFCLSQNSKIPKRDLYNFFEYILKTVIIFKKHLRILYKRFVCYDLSWLSILMALKLRKLYAENEYGKT